MNKEQLKELRKKSFIAGCPIEVEFKDKEGNIKLIPATRGEEVVRWSDVLKINRDSKTNELDFERWTNKKIKKPSIVKFKTKRDKTSSRRIRR